MSGGTSEIHRDNEPLATGFHRGASGSVLIDPGAMFDVVVATTGLCIVNTTTGMAGRIVSISGDTITSSFGSSIDGLAFRDIMISFGGDYLTFGEILWTAGDAYEIYKTATKGSIISTQWTDVSRGWKTPQHELVDGWREEDRDINRDGAKIWGEGQPENYRR